MPNASGKLKHLAVLGRNASGVIQAQIKRISNGTLVATPDVIFECVGVPGLLQQCIELAPVRARVVVVGLCMQPDTILPALAIAKELRLDFVVAYTVQDFAFTIDMLASERVRSAAMITDRVGFADFPAAFEALKQPSTQCKVLVTPGAC